jgi:hypothetical protein
VANLHYINSAGIVRLDSHGFKILILPEDFKVDGLFSTAVTKSVEISGRGRACPCPNRRKAMTVMACQPSGQGQALPLQLLYYIRGLFSGLK